MTLPLAFAAFGVIAGTAHAYSRYGKPNSNFLGIIDTLDWKALLIAYSIATAGILAGWMVGGPWVALVGGLTTLALVFWSKVPA